MTPRRYRLTFRTRMALSYAGLLAGAGALMMTLTAVFIVYFPTYTFKPADTIPALPSAPEGTLQTGEPSMLQSAPAVTVSSREDLLVLFLVAGSVILVVIAALGGLVGYRIAGRVLRPLQEVSDAAKQAATGKLDHRIDLGTPRDEVTELAGTFDDMLEGLETSFHAHQRFAANASHELQTPLATTKAVLDVALASHAAPTREVLQSIRQMNDRSIATVDALLKLSDIESAQAEPDVACDLGAIAEASLGDLDARDRQVSASFSPAAITGDPHLLRSLVDNLLLNAVRHNTAGGTITASTTTEDGRAVLRVENSGAVITDAQAETLTEPFVRLAGRTGSGRSHGLGLAIVAAIARRHHATLTLVPRPGGGLIATVVF